MLLADEIICSRTLNTEIVPKTCRLNNGLDFFITCFLLGLLHKEGVETSVVTVAVAKRFD